MLIKNANKNSTAYLIFFSTLLVIIGLVGSLTIDMYVPALPHIAKYFNISSTAVKYTIALYLITYALGQFFIGPIIDSFGRRNFLIISVLIGTVGSYFCLNANSIDYLYLGRFLQGIGYAAIGSAAPAMARDVFDDKQFAQVASIFSLAFGLGTTMSPIIGSYISYYFGWRMIFEVIFVYSIFVVIILLFLIPETLDKEKRTKFDIVNIVQNYIQILKNKVFIKNTISKASAYTGFIVFYTVTPFMLQDHLHLTTVQYGWITLSLTSTVLLSKLVNAFVLRFFDINKIIYMSIVTLAIASLLLFIFALFQQYSAMTIILPYVVFGFGGGFLFSNTTAAAFQPFKGVSSGSVSSLLNGIQILSAFIGAAIAAHLGLLTLMPLAIFMVVLSGFALLQYRLLSN